MAITTASPAEWFRALRAGMTIIEAYLRLRLCSIEATREWASTRSRAHASRRDVMIAFHRAARRLPETCLVRALALQRMMSANGYLSELKIGVTRSGSALEAHAWLTDDEGQILVGAGEAASSFTLLANWPASNADDDEKARD
jgi:Transglutaminase-like superfamily